MRHKDLAANLTKGDPEAFRFLFSEYYVPLCVYASRFTKDKNSAEEIVHETFVKLWEQKEHIGITDSVTGYLYKAVQNNALNYLKKLQIKNKYSEAYFERLRNAEEFFTISQENGQSVLLVKELEAKIIEAVETLPDECKEIFKLSRFVGLKNQEIAEKKKISLNTVQKQISIALAKLRKHLGPYLPYLIHIIGFLQMMRLRV